MDVWEFRDYVTDDNKNHSQVWYGTLSKEAQAEHTLVIRLLAKTKDWDANKKTRRQHKLLLRDHAGLTQIMFEVRTEKAGKRETKRYRILGIMKDAEKKFIMFNGCEKHGTAGNIPPDAFEIAMKLKVAYEQGRGETNAHY
jgi:hypothetical protein